MTCVHRMTRIHDLGGALRKLDRGPVGERGSCSPNQDMARTCRPRLDATIPDYSAPRSTVLSSDTILGRHQRSSECGRASIGIRHSGWQGSCSPRVGWLAREDTELEKAGPEYRHA